MTRTVFLLASSLFVVACGGSPKPVPVAAETKAPPLVASEKPKAPAPEKYDLKVWASYTDFSGHGFNGSGRFYKRADGGWQSAQCSMSHVADPQAGPSAPPSCGEWSAVPKDQWDTLETARKNHDELWCKDQPDACKVLGIAPAVGKTMP